MHIFIDESGTFSSPGTAAVSAVGALVVRNRKLPYLLSAAQGRARRFRKRRAK